MKNILKKIKIKYLLLFIIISILTFCFTCFSLTIQGDEIWNYGFSYNISKGMVIYKDFNVLPTPLYFILGSIFINIFGNYLISLHIMNAIIISIMIFMLFKILKFKVLIIYPFILMMATPSYNLLCLFWLILILYLIHEKKDNNLIMGLIVGLLFITKQNLGIFLFAIYIFKSKNKLKSITSFLIPFIILSIYLIINNAYCDFINYCFLGMIDFGTKNTNFINYILVIVELVILISLIYKLAKTNFKDKSIIYVLGFQIILYPLVDIYHFLICFVPVLFIIIRDLKITLKGNVIVFCILCFIFIRIPDVNKINKEKNYLFLRNEINIESIEIAYNKYKNYDYNFFCFINAYYYKLYMNLEINKFDLMLNGNMGYNGANNYIKEINNICKTNSCVFFINENMYDNNNQFSKEIFNNVITNYQKKEEYENFSIYINTK